MTAHARAVGISYRRLDYWTRAGYLRPANSGLGSGVWRQWSEHELNVARAMARLVTAGLTVPVAARCARAHVESGAELLELAPGVAVLFDDAGT